MVAAAGGDMDRSKDFFVLDVAARGGEDLGAEAEFTEFASDRVGDELGVVGGDGFGVAVEEFGFLDPAVGDMHEAHSAVFVAHRELPAPAGGDEINLACREVGDIGFIAPAESVTFLSLLPAEFHTERVSFSGVEEIDLHPIRLRHAEPHFFRIDADIVVTDREAGSEDGGVHSMQGGAAEFVLLRERGERRGG